MQILVGGQGSPDTSGKTEKGRYRGGGSTIHRYTYVYMYIYLNLCTILGVFITGGPEVLLPWGAVTPAATKNIPVSTSFSIRCSINLILDLAGARHEFSAYQSALWANAPELDTWCGSSFFVVSGGGT